MLRKKVFQEEVEKVVDSRIIKEKVTEYEQKLKTCDACITVFLAVLSVLALFLAIASVTWQQNGLFAQFIPPITSALKSSGSFFVTFVVGFAVILFLAVFFSKKRDYERKLESLQPSVRRLLLIEQMNRSMDEAFREINYSKVRNILRNTYEDVTEWNPMNIRNNVLTYDVHEHIRQMLVWIKRSIISLAPERLNSENVVIDFAFQYPKANNSFQASSEHDDSTGTEESRAPEGIGVTNSPEQAGNEEKDDQYINCSDENGSDKWVVISSGDNSGGNSNTAYLKTSLKGKSFYSWVYSRYYAFLNDKCDGEKIRVYNLNGNNCTTNSSLMETYPCYILSPKDIEYAQIKQDNSSGSGSIVGIRIDLRNDDPKKTLVSSILTINTYKEPLFISDGVMTEEVFKALFKANIVDNIKSIITSELAQMYIRHMIREEHLCPYTGRFEIDNCDWKTCDISKCDSIKVFFKRLIQTEKAN